MTRRMIAPLLFGLIGTAILLWLGLWQVQRMGEKNAIIAQISARIDRPPVPLPENPDPAADKYLAVQVTGVLGEREIHVLVGRGLSGAGYRVITTLDTGTRRVLLERGVVPAEAKDAPRPGGWRITVTGNLHWPREVDGFTPEPDLKANIWFARDVPAMAEALGAEPVLIVARSDTGDGVEPRPVSPTDLRNVHLEYAITWFLLAIAWMGMTAYLLWRIKRREV